MISVAALLLFIGVRRLPTGTALGHMDFRVSGGNSIEFCDPANPQFLPVVDVPSPVVSTLAPETAERGREQRFELTLRTAGGKPIGTADLAVAHTEKLHLLVVDPSLQDYQHVHPQPTDEPGRWAFALTPQRSGRYRVFADFVPIATGRGLYAAAEFVVPGEPETPVRSWPTVVERVGMRFTLEGVVSVRAREPAEFTLVGEAIDGGAVRLAPVMGAFAHLVAFDETRRGFAHLHPLESDLSQQPDMQRPRLRFRVTFPEGGRYVVWAQMKIGEADLFAPFAIDVR